MSNYSEFHVEFNGYSPINRNDPQQVEIFGPASLKKDVNKSIAEFSSDFAQSVLAKIQKLQFLAFFDLLDLPEKFQKVVKAVWHNA